MTLLIILFILLSLTSCSPQISPTDRDIYLVTIADDFYNYNGNGRKLGNVITDQAAIYMQFQTLGDINVKAYISQNGERYSSSSPIYIPVDKNGNELSFNMDSSFKGFKYKPKDGEEEDRWNIYVVMEYLGTLELGENDLLILTYSGHGEKNSGNLMTNASQTTADYDALKVEELNERVSSLGGKKLIVLDSCYSGQFVSSSPLTSADVFSDKDKEDRWLGKNYIKAMVDSVFSPEKEGKDYTNLWILSSSGKSQEASDSLDGGDGPFQLSYGAFTYYLLKGLGYDTDRNEAVKKEERVTVYSLYSYIRRNFPDYETQIQTPRVSYGPLDLIII